jgi:murein DD-endopeptidase MepM/ murein hydrolase activator NlpD
LPGSTIILETSLDVPNGPDFGQYPGKFNWHNFLIFPTWAAGYDAIAKLLRTSLYVNLSILDAFKKYTPESDGNNPVAYANAVTAALGIPVSTGVGDLDDEQMQATQNKIQEIEGVIAGASLSWDSDEIPTEISELLPVTVRKYSRPRTLVQARSQFTIDMSAPVDTSGFTQGFGGQNQGGHLPPQWYIQFGMDIGGSQGTAVYAVFDGHITKFKPHNPAQDNSRVYGAEIFMRSPNDMVGGFYTHITDVPDGLAVGSTVARGDFLGTVHSFGGIPPHLHLALVEIVGGTPAGNILDLISTRSSWNWSQRIRRRLFLFNSGRTARHLSHFGVPRKLAREAQWSDWTADVADLSTVVSVLRACYESRCGD